MVNKLVYLLLYFQVCIFLHRYIKESSFVAHYQAAEQAANLQSATATSFSPLIEKDQTSAWQSFRGIINTTKFLSL